MREVRIVASGQWSVASDCLAAASTRRGIGGKRRVESGEVTGHRPPVTGHCSRRGLSLLEVLVSCFILTFGLLGIASLIPLGKIAMSEANVADRTGVCGRAAVREIEVRRMLDLTNTNWSAQTGVLCMDPLGASIGNTLGPLPRLTYTSLTATQLDAIFRSNDELVYVLPEDDSGTDFNGERPMPMPGLSTPANQQSLGNFTWFFTVCPSPSDINNSVPVSLRRNYTVSVAVCHKRDFITPGEYSSQVSFVGGIGYGGGTVNLTSNLDTLNHLKTDRWVMLVNTAGTVAKWYRVVGVGDGSDASTAYVSLVGPDWDTNACSTPTMVVVEGVTGVYTTTIQLDDDLMWTR